MSRRTAIVGLIISGALLILTVLVIAGPSLPGPHIREWLGFSPPGNPPCEFDPAKVLHPPGRPAAGSWRKEPLSPTSSPEVEAATVGGEIYIVGGQTPQGAEDKIRRFDPASGKYETVAHLPVEIDHPAVTAHDGEVVVASGFIDGAYPTNRAWTFNPRTGVVRELPSMHFPRGAAAVAALGERLYVAGGEGQYGNQYEPRHSLEIYDFGTGEWTIGPDMPTARHHFGAAALDGKIYFVGGRQPTDLSLSTFEAFDPASEEWETLPPLPVGSGSLGVTGGDGEVLAVGGGEDGLHLGEGKYVLRTTYAYNVREGRWRRLPDMLQPRHGEAVAVADGRLYAFRGIPCPDYGHMATAESLALE